MTRSPTRELARRAVQTEIAEIAERLFLANGYEKTKVDDIASAAQISPRTFFRYFATKDDVLFLKADRAIEDLFVLVDERPLEVSPWDALKEVLHIATEMSATGQDSAWTEPLQQILVDAPSLTPAVVNRLEQMQEQLAQRLRARAGIPEGGTLACTPAEVLLKAKYRALAGAAIAGVHGTHLQPEFASLPLSEKLSLLDQVLESLRPRDPELGGPG